MEPSQTSPPAGSPAPPAPTPLAPGAAANDSAKAGVAARLGVAVLVLVLLFLAAVAVIAVADIGSLTPCDEININDPASVAQLNSDGECFDGSSTKQLITLIIGWPGAILACVSVLLAIAFVIRGRGGRILAMSIGGSVVLFGLSILVGSL
jgi:hypothetical protein